jgi:hypothetical protein
LEYGLELLGLAVGRGQTVELMRRGPAAGGCDLCVSGQQALTTLVYAVGSVQATCSAEHLLNFFASRAADDQREHTPEALFPVDDGGSTDGFCVLVVLAGRLWTVLLRQLQAHKTMNATRAQRLGRTAALLLLGLVRIEQRQAAAVRLTAAGGPAVQGVVELQVSSQLVS